MSRLCTSLAVLAAVSVIALGAALAGAGDKPKDATVLDDRTATVTETVDGKEKESKVELKYSLKVKGYFDKDGYHIEEVDSDGPATALDDGNGNMAALEKGDIIVSVDGKPVKSAKDYVKAMNDAADHSKTKIKVKDVNTGNDQEFYANAAKR
jgi:membrane-associated protease RseP (regulator of RpoE activity)